VTKLSEFLPDNQKGGKRGKTNSNNRVFQKKEKEGGAERLLT